MRMGSDVDDLVPVALEVAQDGGAKIRDDASRDERGVRVFIAVSANGCGFDTR